MRLARIPRSPDAHRDICNTERYIFDRRIVEEENRTERTRHLVPQSNAHESAPVGVVAKCNFTQACMRRRKIAYVRLSGVSARRPLAHALAVAVPSRIKSKASRVDFGDAHFASKTCRALCGTPLAPARHECITEHTQRHALAARTARGSKIDPSETTPSSRDQRLKLRRGHVLEHHHLKLRVIARKVRAFSRLFDQVLKQMSHNTKLRCCAIQFDDHLLTGHLIGGGAVVELHEACASVVRNNAW